MAVKREKKEAILGELETIMSKAKSIAFTKSTGLTVEDLFNIRRDLRKSNAGLMYAKKTLIKRAFKTVHGQDLDDSMLEGQIAVLSSNDDALAGISIANKYVKEFQKDEKIKFAWAFFEGKILGVNDTLAIANLPSREVLLARLLGSMKSPLGSFVRLLEQGRKDLEEKNLATLKDLAK